MTLPLEAERGILVIQEEENRKEPITFDVLASTQLNGCIQRHLAKLENWNEMARHVSIWQQWQEIPLQIQHHVAVDTVL